MNLVLGIFFFAVGQTFAWFQLNCQIMSEWWKDKPLLSAMTFGVPASISFWYAWKYVFQETETVWSARFIGSSTGYLVFPILTWYMLNESMFTTKTIVCLFLAILIILIQVFY